MTLTLFMWLFYHDTTTLHDNLVISYLRPLMPWYTKGKGAPLFIRLHGSYGVAIYPPSTLFFIFRVFSTFILSYKYFFSREFYTSPSGHAAAQAC